MKSRSSSINMHLTIFCVLSLILRSALAETISKPSSEQELKKSTEENNDTLTRRQDNGFDLMSYFMRNQQQQQQQPQQQAVVQQVRQPQVQQPVSVLRQLQQLTPQQLQQLTPQQLQQLQQLYQLQQQQLLLQQQATGGNEIYQENTAQQQQQVSSLNREGYGQVGVGGYGGGYPGQGKQIGITIGGGKPPNVIGVGNILTLLPRIINVLSAGGKVMFGMELGNNFYFGPVGAKPLYG